MRPRGMLVEFGDNLQQRFGVNRSLLMGVGLVCMILGIIAFAIPVRLFRTMVFFVGIVLMLSSLVKGWQFLLGIRSKISRNRGWPLICLQVLLDASMGILLLNHQNITTEVLAGLFGLLFSLEGLILIYVALRSPTVLSRNWLLTCGFLIFIIGLIIAFRLVEKPLGWVGMFVGFKLFVFGLSLFWIALRTMKREGELIYDAIMPVPRPAECYAVYFGTAFHLGIYIGDGQVVHFLNDNHVYKLTWEEFLLGRVPQHWTYPDLPEKPIEDVVRTALSEVGKTYQYNLLRFNCEHFALYCKSVGQTSHSEYAQIKGGLIDIGAHPFLGMIAEMNTRMVEWLAFHFGGPAGKKFSLRIRKLGATLTTWLVWLGAERRQSNS